MSPHEYFELKKTVVMGILNILNLKLACFCVLSQNHQHFFEIYCMYLKVHCPRNSKALKF